MKNAITIILLMTLVFVSLNSSFVIYAANDDEDLKGNFIDWLEEEAPISEYLFILTATIEV